MSDDSPEPAVPPSKGDLPPLLMLDFARLKRNLLLMLNYAVARPDIHLDAALVDIVVETCRSADDSLPADFWKAYDTLAVAIRPATAESIAYANMEEDATPPRLTDFLPFSRKARFTSIMVSNTFWLVIAFFLTLVFQIHATIGLNLAADLTKALRADSFDPPQVASIAADLQSWSLMPLSTASTLDENEGGSPISPTDPIAIKSHANAVLERAESVLTALSNHVLPALYGFLGACAFIVRALYEKLMTTSLLPGQRFSYALRRLLGTTLGFASGMFWDITGKESGDTKLLTLAAFAFLMGYSIEAMFSLLDALVNKISESFKTDQKPPPPPTTVSLPAS